MKKLFVLMIILSTLLLLSACGEPSGPKVQEEPAADAVTETTTDEIAVSENSIQEEAPAEEAQEETLLLEQVTWEHLTRKTLPKEGAWLKETDQVSLVAAIEEKNIYMYCLHNGHPWGGQGVILQYGDTFQTYPLWCMIKYEYPVLECCDLDADGDEEILLVTGRSGGTGLHIEDLYVFEPGAEGYTCIPLETAQIAALINEQVSFALFDDDSLQATCRDGAVTNMKATRNTGIFLDHISFRVENGIVTLSTSVQVIEEDGQWKYLCEYLDEPSVDKDQCAAAEYIYTIEAETTYNGAGFALENLHLAEAERVT